MSEYLSVRPVRLYLLLLWGCPIGINLRNKGQNRCSDSLGLLKFIWVDLVFNRYFGISRSLSKETIVLQYSGNGSHVKNGQRRKGWYFSVVSIITQYVGDVF